MKFLFEDDNEKLSAILKNTTENLWLMMILALPKGPLCLQSTLMISEDPVIGVDYMKVDRFL